MIRPYTLPYLVGTNHHSPGLGKDTRKGIPTSKRFVGAPLGGAHFWSVLNDARRALLWYQI
jgi:hypothetical protein